MEGIELRLGRLRPPLLGAALALVIADRGRDRAEPGRPPIHLLPLLMTEPRQENALERLMPEDFESIAEMEAEARPGREGEPHGDDSLMERFDRWGLRRFSAWDGVKAIALTTFLLLLFAGGAVHKAADELKPGLGRDIIKAIASPAGWVADELPLAGTRRDLTSWLSPDQKLTGRGFQASGGAPSPSGLAPVPTTPQPLHRLLVTGDSLSTPAGHRDRPQAGRPGRRRAGHPRSTPGHRHLQHRPGRLGQALLDAGLIGPSRCRRHLHRRQRGLPDARAQRQGR